MTELRPQVAVGAVVLRDDQILLVKRGREPARGKWTLPGGRLEHGEYIEAAVVREVTEETGLTVVPERLLGIFEVVGDPHYVILDHLCSMAEGNESEPVAGDDVDEVAWVDLDKVAELDLTPRFVETLSAWGILKQG